MKRRREKEKLPLSMQEEESIHTRPLRTLGRKASCTGSRDPITSERELRVVDPDEKKCQGGLKKSPHALRGNWCPHGR